MFESVHKDQSGISFRNEVYNTEQFNIFSYRNFYNGGGVGIGDINNDGLVDVFLTSNMAANKLFLNLGDFRFADISEEAGISSENQWSTGVTMVDLNADGFLDIYVANAGNRAGSDQKNQLYINNGDNTFTESANLFNLDEEGYTTHASFFDYDLDGDLDAYILNNSFIPVNTLNYNNKRELRAKDWPVKDFLQGGGDKLLRNDGGNFVDVSEEAGIFGSLIGFGLGVLAVDLNNDKYPDIYVCNDFFERDYLYINNKDGTFAEKLTENLDQISHSSMGADFADINNDGFDDLFVTDMLPADDVRLKRTTTFDNIDLRKLKVKQGFYNQFMKNTLQLNKGDGSFSEISKYAGVDASDWSWGALFMDADNDGYQDILTCNGIYKDVIDQDFIDFFANDVIQKQALTGEKTEIESIINKMPSVPLRNLFFKNLGGQKFVENGSEWGISEETFSNGAAYGDLDNDGDLDLVINNVNQEVSVYRNNSKANYLGLVLQYTKANPRAVGAKVNLYSGDLVFSKTIMPARGFQSSVDERLLFGLGQVDVVDSVMVRWPNGTWTKLDGYEINTYQRLTYDENSTKFTAAASANQVDLEPQANFFAKHEEDDFDDFYLERNIPTRFSKEGPCLASADLNNDGIEDVYIGSGQGTSSKLYLSSQGGYKVVQEEFFARFKDLEDTAAEFIDVDEDGDQDLVVGSGGNNAQYSNRAFVDRLYLNNQGTFDYSHNAIPPNALNTSVIKAYDFNGDGFDDLMVGSRSVPGEYGLSPGSFLYLNDRRGRFRDVTKNVAPELPLAGMVTDAEWVDLLGDSMKELVLVGEWMSPKILKLDGSQFALQESNLSSYSGFWQDIELADVDNDGDQDLILGNIGENFSLEADSTSPLLMWINDFDGNGSLEKVITRNIGGRDKPIFMKRDLVEQIPSLKKQNLLHKDYANKGIHDLFASEILKKSTVKQVNYLSSVVAKNDGNGKFSLEVLGPEAQYSSVNAILSTDINGDGHDDLLLAGNNTDLLPQLSQLDANKGQIHINRGNGTYDYHSELGLEGVVREIKKVNNLIVFGINNRTPAVFKVRKE